MKVIKSITPTKIYYVPTSPGRKSIKRNKGAEITFEDGTSIHFGIIDYLVRMNSLSVFLPIISDESNLDAFSGSTLLEIEFITKTVDGTLDFEKPKNVVIEDSLYIIIKTSKGNLKLLSKENFPEGFRLGSARPNADSAHDIKVTYKGYKGSNIISRILDKLFGR